MRAIPVLCSASTSRCLTSSRCWKAKVGFACPPSAGRQRWAAFTEPQIYSDHSDYTRFVLLTRAWRFLKVPNPPGNNTEPHYLTKRVHGGRNTGAAPLRAPLNCTSYLTTTAGVSPSQTKHTLHAGPERPSPKLSGSGGLDLPAGPMVRSAYDPNNQSVTSHSIVNKLACRTLKVLHHNDLIFCRMCANTMVWKVSGDATVHCAGSWYFHS